MIDTSNEKLSTCNHTGCDTITNRQFLDYAFSSHFMYEVVFQKAVDIDPQEICSEQWF